MLSFTALYDSVRSPRVLRGRVAQDFAEAALGPTGWWLSALSSTLSLFGMIFGGLVAAGDLCRTKLGKTLLHTPAMYSASLR